MNLYEQILNIALTLEGGILLAFLTAVSLTSLFEREKRAAFLSLLAGLLLALPFLLPFFLGFQYQSWISLSLSGLIILPFLVLFFPFRGRIEYSRQNPRERFDERDTMFSRRSLTPGTERYDEYYARQPGNKPVDNKFRPLPGLLKAGTKYYDPILFAAANSIFEKVDELQPRVEGDAAAERVRVAGQADVSGYPKQDAGTEGNDPDIDVVRTDPDVVQTDPDVVQTDPDVVTAKQLSQRLIRMAVDWGAHSAGITELRDYHVYSYGGRGDRYGHEFKVEHKYALALIVEMDYDMMRTAPAAPTVLESANQYLQSGMIAVQLAEFIRSLGFPARAHIDGNYKVICPLVARDAGLGEIGRMGLLMTPRLGPRCRIAVVTTDLPLVSGTVGPKPADSNTAVINSVQPVTPDPNPAVSSSAQTFATVIDFCRRCEKCAAVCPSQSIPHGPEQEIDGVKRWKIDDAACYTYWCQAGTDCGRCMIVCPFSHSDNWLHHLIRFGIRNNALFRRLAVPMDDLFYGKIPKPRSIKSSI